MPFCYPNSLVNSGTWTGTFTQDPTTGSDIVFNVSGTGLRMGTSDGADNKILMLTGGGAVNSSGRGAYASLNGNEAASPGQFLIGGGNVSGGDLVFQTQAASSWTITYSSNSNFIFNKVNALIAASTSDGSDNGTLYLCGGGSNSTSRGALITIGGNENAGTGSLIISAGDAAGGALSLNAPNSDISLKAGTGTANTMWAVIGSTGSFSQDGTNGGQLLMPRTLNTANTGIILGASSRPSDVPDAGLIVFTDVNTVIQALFQQSTNDVNGSLIYFNKTRKTDNTADTIVVNGDTISKLVFQGADGASFRPAAQIVVTVDGTPGVADMPGAIDLQTTPDGSATPVSALKLANNGGMILPRTNTPGGTTGAQTINKPNGSVNFAAAATTLVVTNSLVTTSSNIFAMVQTGDATALIKNVIPASGSFTITLNAAATAETRVAFWVTN